MFFYLDFQFKTSSINTALLTDGDPLPAFPEANMLYLQQGKQRLLSHEVPGGKLLILGDPVFQKKENPFDGIVTEPGKVNEAILYQEVKGHYYWFYLSPTSPLLCGNSFGAIYPVYYSKEDGRIVVSSSSFTIAMLT